MNTVNTFVCTVDLKQLTIRNLYTRNSANTELLREPNGNIVGAQAERYNQALRSLSPRTKYGVAQSMSPLARSRATAVVAGAGLGGLLSARMLSRHFGNVCVLEQHALPSDPTPRKGVPQGYHVHGLLARGGEYLKHWFPGLDNTLARAGAPILELGQDVASRFPQGWLPRFRSGINIRCCSRGLLEWALRKQLMETSGVSFVEQARVVSMQEGAQQITVHFTQGGRAQVVDAQFFVDASGRGSRAPDWLAGLGYAPPAETIVDANLGYATRWFEEPPRRGREWSMMVIMPRYPDNYRGGVILPVENKQWMVFLAGLGGHHPPADEEGYFEFARRLVEPGIFQAIQGARGLSRIFKFRQTANRWRHFERLPAWPERFAVLGDAACTLNPYYAQGMTVCALQVEALDAELRRRGSGGDAGARFQQQAARIVRAPWVLATSTDLRWPATTGDRRLRDQLMHRYLDKVLALATEDPGASIKFLQVMHMLKPPQALLSPALMARALCMRSSGPENRAW